MDVFPIRFAGKPEIGGAAHDAKAKAGIAQNSGLEFLIPSTLCKNFTSLDISNHIPFIDHIPLLGTDSVSYTHLDVYKRQIWISAA